MWKLDKLDFLCSDPFQIFDVLFDFWLSLLNQFVISTALM